MFKFLFGFAVGVTVTSVATASGAMALMAATEITQENPINAKTED